MSEIPCPQCSAPLDKRVCPDCGGECRVKTDRGWERCKRCNGNAAVPYCWECQEWRDGADQ